MLSVVGVRSALSTSLRSSGSPVLRFSGWNTCTAGAAAYHRHCTLCEEGRKVRKTWEVAVSIVLIGLGYTKVGCKTGIKTLLSTEQEVGIIE